MKSIKESKKASFALVCVVYLLAAAVGIGVYLALPFAWWLSLLIADVAATLLTFACSVILSNASVYDPYWSVQPIVILIAFFMQSSVTPPRVLLLIAVCLWGVRLTANWAYTFGNLTHQDWRYTMLKQKTGAFYPLINLLGIHLVPTLVVWGCILPAVYVMLQDSALNVGFCLFVLLCLLAVLLQGSADCQMHRFRRRKTGGFIREGLWKHARHPNYLGEILMWWGVALATVCLFPSAWYLCAGALANTLLFCAVSIPMAERKQSKKPGFAAYKAQTRVLLPVPKKQKENA